MLNIAQPELDLGIPSFQTNLARRSDPITSKVAALLTSEFSGNHREIVLQALRKFGPMTVDQIASRTRLNSQQVNKRLPELQRMGLAQVVAGETRLSASGRPERVWNSVAFKN